MRSRQMLLVLAVCAANAWGQASAGFGAVTGIVLDAGGQGLPDAIVTLTNRALGTQRTMSTTDDGVFHSSTVIPAAGYEIQVSRKDFATWDSGLFLISTGQDVNFVVTLPVAESANGVKAIAQGGVLQVDNSPSGIGAVVTPQQIQETPDSGRTMLPLALLAPAVTQAYSKPGVLVYHGVPFSNLSLTDGLPTTNTYFRLTDGFPKQLPESSVQDFQIASADFLTEYGGTSSGVFNAATRAGTNSLHGEAFEFYRNGSLQASDRYAAGYDTTQKQHQAGASVGGAIIPDKVFFFLSFELLDRSAQGLNRINNPLIADPSGTHVQTSNCQATAAQCAVATRFLQSQMNVLTPLWEHSQRGVARIDYRRSERNNLRLEGNILQWKSPSLAETETVAPNGGLLGDPILRDQTRYAKVGWTAVGIGQISNDLRLGFYQDRISETPSTSPLVSSPVGINIAGTTVGAVQPYSVVAPSERRLQLVDTAQWTLGTHSLKVGLEFSKTRDYLDSLTNATGLYTYPSLTAFAQDFSGSGLRSYTSFTQTLGDPSRTLDQRMLTAYVEDTWRANQRFTLDFGIRYDRPHLPQPIDTNTSYYQTGTITAPWLDLSPRVGLAYMINDRTVVRAGFGFYYEPIPGQLLDALYLGNAIYQTNISVNPNQGSAPIFPNIYPIVTAVPTGVTNAAYSTTSFKNPYSQETSIALERRVAADTTITLSLLHNRGIKLWTTQDYNQANPTTQVTSETYNIQNTAGQNIGTYPTQYWIAKNNPAFAHVNQIENGGSSWYNGASVQLRKRFSHGLSALATYTWSHAIDNAGQIAPFGTAFSSTIDATYSADRGNSAFDQRHRAVIQWSYQPSVGQGGSAVVRHVVNGWSLSSITTLASSQYGTPIVIVQGQQFSGVTMNYTSSLNGSGGWARAPFLPIGSLPTGPEYNVDARIARTFPFGERIRATILFEAFNVFNTQFDTAVNTIAYTSVPVIQSGLANGPQVGTIRPVAGTGSGIAAQGFPDGTNARRAQVALRITF